MDSFGSGLEASLTDECTCAFCMDLYEEPVQLPCQHSFCQACLNSYAQSKKGPKLKCPVCVTEHPLKAPGDISGFPVDLFAKRVVAHLKAQRDQAAKKPLPNAQLQLDPSAIARASAPDAEPEEADPIVIAPRSTESAANGVASAPPMELFDPPPKIQADSPALAAANGSPSFWDRIFKKSPKPSSSAPSSPSPSAPVASSSSPLQPSSSSLASPSYVTPSAPEAVHSAPNASYAASSSSSHQLQPSRAAPNPLEASSSNTNPPMTFSRAQAVQKNVEKANSGDKLGLSRAEHHSKRKRSKPVEMPPGLLPPREMLVQGCRPLFDKEEIWMPFVIPLTDVRKLWSQWLSTLWFTDVQTCRLEGVTQVLVPAWRIAGELTVHYDAVATVRIQKEKGQTIVERHHQTASLKMTDYATVVCGVDQTVPFADLMQLCVMTDQLPMGDSPSFMQWILGSRAEPREMQEFPIPDGAPLERDANWYGAWQQSVAPEVILKDRSITKTIEDAIKKSNKVLTHSSISFRSITPVGFHSLSLAPLRIPMYLCNYLHLSSSTTYHFVMSGQNGEIHDGTKRPLTAFGSFMKGVFGGAFSK